MTSLFTEIFALLLSTTFATCASSQAGDSLKWSPHFFAEGNILIPLAGVNEPFKAWIDFESQMGRIEYYDGNLPRFGYDYRVVPFANTITNITKKCVKNIRKENWHLQSIVPDLANFTFHSERIEGDRKIEKWIRNTTEGNVDNRYEMLLYEKDNIICPVRFETKGYNTMFDNHFDHYIIEYKNFSVIKPDSSIFNAAECTNVKTNIVGLSSSQSNTDGVYYFNPMKEFVHNYGEHVDSAFEEFKRYHSRSYTDGTEEHFKRKNYFRQNMRFIHSKNRANAGHKLAVNHFTDYSSEELASMLACAKVEQRDYDPAEYKASFIQNDFKDLPSEVNWHIAGAVTPVKDQGLCGSCWSFAAVGALEGAYFKKHGKRLRFSEQALIDCSWAYNNNGCGGGYINSAYNFMIEHGVPTEEQYGPYLSQNGYCHMANISSDSLTKISSFNYVILTNETSLQNALLNYGPIAVSINASPKSFKFYSSGVYYDNECASNNTSGIPTFNHGMLLVGYGTLHGEPYWLLKNSWSTMWGNDGYMLVSRKDNMCGILSNVLVVAIEST